MCCNFILVVQEIYTKDTSVKGRASFVSSVLQTAVFFIKVCSRPISPD